MLKDDTNVQFREYRYGWLQRVFSILPVFILASLSIYAVSLLIFNLTRWNNTPVYLETSSIVKSSLALFFTSIVSSFVGATFANLKPGVRVSEKGLAIQSLLIWWYLIPWEDVKDIRSVPLFGSRVRLVVVRNLPFSLIHKWIGTMYFAFFQQAFLISSEIDNYDELIHIIKRKIGKELWE